jgi:hypothetical protein
MSNIIGWESHLNLNPSLYAGMLGVNPLKPSGWLIKRVKQPAGVDDLFNLYWVGDVFNREIAFDALPLNNEPITLEEAKELAERLETARNIKERD